MCGQEYNTYDLLHSVFDDLYLSCRMLEDILGTRIMVKNSMKKHKQNKVQTHYHVV